MGPEAGAALLIALALCGLLAALVLALLQRLRRRRRELQQARQALQLQQQTLRRKLRTSLTAAAVAHEINQPLSSLSLISERLISQSEASGHGAEALPMLQVLREESRRVVALIEKMRMLLRSVESDQGPVCLAEVTEAALTYLRRPLLAEGVQLSSEGLAGSRATLHGDAAQLQVAITNLLRNALAALAECRPGQRRLAVALVERAGSLELVVADSGPGLPETLLNPAVARDQPMASTSSTGMGLGLYLVGATVENHRGSMELGRSAKFGGAEVRLRFPLLEPAQRP
jgi:signal transduction histidine kinase